MGLKLAPNLCQSVMAQISPLVRARRFDATDILLLGREKQLEKLSWLEASNFGGKVMENKLGGEEIKVGGRKNRKLGVALSPDLPHKSRTGRKFLSNAASHKFLRARIFTTSMRKYVVVVVSRLLIISPSATHNDTTRVCFGWDPALLTLSGPPTHTPSSPPPSTTLSCRRPFLPQAGRPPFKCQIKLYGGESGNSWRFSTGIVNPACMVEP